MTRYFFNLRDGGRGYRDDAGIELPNDDAAKEHADLVAAELMRNRERVARHWRIDVHGAQREKICEVAFIAHDRTLSHLSPPLKEAMAELSDRSCALREAITEARALLRQAKALVARSRGRPHLVADHGEGILGSL